LFSLFSWAFGVDAFAQLGWCALEAERFLKGKGDSSIIQAAFGVNAAKPMNLA